MSATDWAPLPAAFAAAAGAELAETLGRPVALEPASLRTGSREELLAGGSPGLVSRLVAGEAEAALFFVAPRVLAVAAGAARLGEAVRDDPSEALAENLLAAWTGCAEQLAGALSRVFAEAGAPAGLEHQSSVELEPISDDDVLPAGDYRCQTWTVALGDEAVAELALWLPEARAQAWFGGVPEAADEERRPLAVIDPDPAAREHAEDLAAALGRPVWSLDPAELGPHSFDELREAAALVVAWDLGGVPGIDLLDDLRRDPRTAQLPVALAGAAATRESVLTALRWGAATWVGVPLEAPELTRRLGLG